MSSQIGDFKPNISNGEQRRTGCLPRTGTAAIWFWSHQEDQMLQTERHSTNMQQKAVHQSIPKMPSAISFTATWSVSLPGMSAVVLYTLQYPVHQCSSSGSCPNDRKGYAPLPLPPAPTTALAAATAAKAQANAARFRKCVLQTKKSVLCGWFQRQE